MSDQLIFLGFVIILIGILVVILSSSSKNVKFAFGGFIGPVPFGFGNDPKLVWMIVFITLLVLFFFITPTLRGLL